MRQVIGDRQASPPVLDVSAQTIRFNCGSHAWVDATAFTRVQENHPGRHSGGEAVPGQRADLLASAVDWYQGNFLEGFSLPDSPAFEEWALLEREYLQRQALAALSELIDLHIGRCEFSNALHYAWRQVELDPWRETAQRTLMRLLALTDQCEAALAQYRTCCRALADELGIEPTAETKHLFEQIRNRSLRVPTPPAAPVPVQQVLSPRTSGSDASTSEKGAQPIFVAREEELAQLSRFLDDALAGEGRVVFVSGDAGRGKTALMLEFARRATHAHGELLIAAGNCTAHSGLGDPYAPFRRILNTLAGMVTLDPDSKFLDDFLSPGPRHPDELLVLAARSQLFEKYTEVLQRLAARHPLLLILDDLQWVDAGSASLLFHLVREVEDTRILVVGAYRPEEVACGRHGERHPLEAVLSESGRRFGKTRLDLTEADEMRGRAFVDAYLDAETNALGENFRTSLFRHTQGHPLFTIELLRSMRERGNLVQDEAGRWVEGPTLDWETLPERVEAVISGRLGLLDRMLHCILEVASVEGGTFTAEVIAQALGEPEGRILRVLSEELAFRHHLVREVVEGHTHACFLSQYRFVSTLFQEYLYRSLSRGERQRLHAGVAAALEALHAGHTATIAAALARHYTEAGNAAKAIEYLLCAGDQARIAYANLEAIGYFRKAIHFLKEAKDFGRAAQTLMKLGLCYDGILDFKNARLAYVESFTLRQRADRMRPTAPLPPAPHPLRMGWPEPKTLDPGLCAGIVSQCVIDQLFCGLLAIGPEMEILPDAARSWEMFDGGRRYVFRLHKGVRWSDGTALTAQDFEYAWKRVLDRRIGSPSASMLFIVKGATAYHQGDGATPDQLGVRALDDETLEIELESPAGYFLHLLTYCATFAVPQHVVEAHGAAWTKLENIVTNGPFRLESREPGKTMTLSRNPAYHGRFEGNVERVELDLTVPWVEGARLEKYDVDGLDLGAAYDLPPVSRQIALQRHAEEYAMSPMFWTDFIGFDVRRPPFDDVRVRRAFVLATNREELANIERQGEVLPAIGGYVPPGMPGHSPGIGLPYDPDEARRLLVDAGYSASTGRRLPTIRAHMGSLSPEEREHLRVRWRDNLGAEITWLKAPEPEQPAHMFVSAYLADFPDAHDFLGTDFLYRKTGWRDETYTRLVTEAACLLDQAERVALYARADRRLIEEASIMPLFYGQCRELVKPWVKRFPVSRLKFWYWKDVILEPH